MLYAVLNYIQSCTGHYIKTSATLCLQVSWLFVTLEQFTLVSFLKLRFIHHLEAE